MLTTPLAILVVVACALAWTSFDLVRKYLVVEIEPIPLVFLITALQVPLFAFWALLEGGWPPTPGYWLPAVVSVVLNIGANVLFTVALKVSPLSVVIPLLSLTPVFTTLMGIPVLGETPGAVGTTGIAMVVAGAFALHLRPGEGLGPIGLVRAFVAERGAVYMVLVALLWSVAIPLDKLAIARSSPSVHGFVLSAGVAAGLFLWLAARGRLGEVRSGFRRPGLLLAALAASALALGLQLVAIRLAAVAVVETVKRGLGNVAAVALGALLFRERVTAVQWLAVVLMAAGVGLILW